MRAGGRTAAKVRGMTGRRVIAVVVILLAVGAAVSVIAWMGSEGDHEDGATADLVEAEREADYDDEADVFFEDPGGDPGPRERRRAFDWREDDPGTRLTPEQREERRRRALERRERFMNMTPEQRSEWARRRVTISPLGAGAPALQPEDVVTAMQESRERVRQCIRERGGYRALREAMRGGGDGGVGRRAMKMSFDVAADGTIDPSTLALEPEPPEPFHECFTSAIGETRMPPPGESGARVQFDFGGGRGPR